MLVCVRNAPLAPLSSLLPCPAQTAAILANIPFLPSNLMDLVDFALASRPGKANALSEKVGLSPPLTPSGGLKNESLEPPTDTPQITVNGQTGPKTPESDSSPSSSSEVVQPKPPADDSGTAPGTVKREPQSGSESDPPQPQAGHDHSDSEDDSKAGTEDIKGLPNQVESHTDQNIGGGQGRDGMAAESIESRKSPRNSLRGGRMPSLGNVLRAILCLFLLVYMVAHFLATDLDLFEMPDRGDIGQAIRFFQGWVMFARLRSVNHFWSVRVALLFFSFCIALYSPSSHYIRSHLSQFVSFSHLTLSYSHSLALTPTSSLRTRSLSSSPPGAGPSRATSTWLTRAGDQDTWSWTCWL